MEGSSLVLLIVGDVGSLDGTLGLSLFGRNLSALDLELVGVQSDFVGLLLDLDVNVDLALVGPATAELEIEQGDGIVGWLDPVQQQCQRSFRSMKRSSEDIHVGKNVSVGHDFDQGA